MINRIADYSIVELFAVKDDVRFYDRAAIASRHARARFDMVEAVFLAAAHAKIPVNATVQFDNVFASGLLMQPVDVLGDHGAQPSLFFELREFFMARVRGRAGLYHLRFVKIVEILGVIHKKIMREHHFRAVFIFLLIKPVRAPEVGDPAFGRNPRAAEENDAFSRRDHFV